MTNIKERFPMKKFASLLLAVLMVCAMIPFTVSAAVLPGSGTKGDPFLIEDETGWEAFISMVKDDPNYGEGKYFRLEKDLGSKGNEIKSFVNEFSGDFNGNGKTVYYFSKKQCVFQKNFKKL